MGVVQTIDRYRFPKQGGWLGRQARVCFRYDTENSILGEVVRDDREESWKTIIKLDDGRYVLATECQWSINTVPPQEVN